MQRKSVDNDVIKARMKLRKLHPMGIQRIKFGDIRTDGTRGVRFEYKQFIPNLGSSVWTKGSYSYLTDITG